MCSRDVCVCVSYSLFFFHLICIFVRNSKLMTKTELNKKCRPITQEHFNEVAFFYLKIITLS